MPTPSEYIAVTLDEQANMQWKLALELELRATELRQQAVIDRMRAVEALSRALKEDNATYTSK